jgi:FkbM family methyltransferase
MGFLQEQVKKTLLRRGVVISRPPGQFSITEYKLQAMLNRGLKIRTVIDGGAAEGEWTRMIKALAPDARVLMVEPRDDAQASLRSTAAELKDVQLAQVLLGAEERLVTFNESAHQSSMLNAADGTAFGRQRQAQMASIDALMDRYHLEPLDLIKLDLQGYELEALRGAGRALAATQLLILEVSFLPILKDLPLAAEVIAFMSERGFQLYDILGLWHRPLDGALAQGDFAFIRKDHPMIRDGSWNQKGNGHHGAFCD